jgi:Putative Flp pilus-assembly TadE/G-like
MTQYKRSGKRSGAVVPIMAVCMVGLMSFLALAIDIGVMAVARNQAQNAADISALAAARTLNGISSSNFNEPAAITMAHTVASSNAILNTNITTAQVTTAQAGIYEYSTSAQRFEAVFNTTPSGTQTYGVIQVVITTQQPTFFANVMGISSMNVSATATAVHRPNDVSIVLDFSGSMGYSSQINYSGSNGTQSLSPDATYPQFGPYTIFAGPGMVLNYNSPGTAPPSLSSYVPPTPMQRVWPYVDSSGYLYAPNNLTMTTAAGPAIATNFLLTDYSTNAFVYSGSSFPSFTNINVAGATSSNPTAVVTPAPSTFVSDNATSFVGDPFPLRAGISASSGENYNQNGTATTTIATGTAPTPSQYAQCAADILGIARSSVTNTTLVPLWCANGYDYSYTNPTGNVSGATKASPIVITTSAPHNLPAGSTTYVTISGVGGNTAANGTFLATYVSATSFSLSTFTGTTTGNANYSSGGTWTAVTGTQKTAANRFQGFTMGPAYWGKTFYMWPPDPRTPSAATVAMGSTSPPYIAGDWRQRFFLPRTGSSQNMQDNSVFWSSGGAWNNQNPGSSAAYMINYNAILSWLTSGPQTLPASLCSGHVLYYSAIPTTISTSQSTGVISSGASADQAFWKDYIDYVLGAGRWNSSSNMYGSQSANSNTAGTALYYNNPSTTNLAPQITARSSLTGNQKTGSLTGATNASPIVITSAGHGLVTGDSVTISGVTGNTAANGNFVVTVISSSTFSLNGSTGNGSGSGGSFSANVPYMNYADTPVHPLMQFWFGPLSLLGYLHDLGAGNLYNWMPGTCYEAQCWQLKAGIQAALVDIQQNHPNHLASLMFYSGSNGYGTARVNMSLDYVTMKNCLYFPYSLLSTLTTASSTVRPYSNSSGSNSNPAGLTDISDTVIPNAGTDTNPQMGFMVAYNQFSNATDTSLTPNVTYSGRQTAGKVVIFETDGCPNDTCSGTLTGSGAAGNYYYATVGSCNYVGLSTSLNVAAKTDACTVVQQICASTSPSSGKPGYSTTRNPAYVHAVAFGDLFESYSTSTLTPAALRFLCAVQIYGNTSTSPGGTVTAPGTMASWYTDSLSYSTYYSTPQSWKIITGTYTTRITNIQTCVTNIMQSGVQVALIQ